MNNLTRVFLVLLRLAIGWHLLFAGAQKFRPEYRGSEGYLQEASGPLTPFYHWMVGDRLVERLSVPAADDKDRAKDQKGELPRALDAEWEAYFRAFVQHYGLDEKQQKEA